MGDCLNSTGYKLSSFINLSTQDTARSYDKKNLCSSSWNKNFEIFYAIEIFGVPCLKSGAYNLFAGQL